MTPYGYSTTENGQFNPPKWVFKLNIPRLPRLRVRATAGRDGWWFIVTDDKRRPIGSDFGTFPQFDYWTDEARTLYALVRARAWLLLKYPDSNPESLVSMVNVAPAREARGKVAA